MAGNNGQGVVNVADKLWEILESGYEERLDEFRNLFIQFSKGKADPNNIKVFQNRPDYSLTMLQYCSQHNLCVFAEFLINENCDLNKAAGKETDPPLMIAVSEGYLDLVNLLMAKNAVLNQKNAAKQTLLHILTVRLRMESPRKKYLECLKGVLSKNKGIAAMNNAQGNFQEVPTGNSAAKGCYIQLNNMERRNRYIDVNAQDSLGNTALHYATYSGNCLTLNETRNGILLLSKFLTPMFAILAEFEREQQLELNITINEQHKLICFGLLLLILAPLKCDLGQNLIGNDLYYGYLCELIIRFNSKILYPNWIF